MKLNHRYTLAYAGITLFALIIGFAIVYAALSRASVQATAGQLEHLHAVVAGQLRRGPDDAGHPTRREVRVTPVAAPGPLRRLRVSEEWDAALQARVSAVRLTTYARGPGNDWYRLDSRQALIRPADAFLVNLVLVFAWTFVFLMALVVILSELISWRILRPLNDTLRSIAQFQLGQQRAIAATPSGTEEFNALSQFLVSMTDRAQRDYRGLQEFSENASHELQTPIASIKAKIELLMDSPLQESQLRMLTAMHDELERLAKINQALTLLAKLEHHEPRPAALTDLSRLVPATAQHFADMAELKELRLTQELAPKVRVPLDETLAQLLLNNLFSNAIRHNVPGGQLQVRLTPARLELRNTGQPPTAPPEELFGRFKKGNQALDSIGVGLAIVRRIAELYGHRVEYTYAEGWHTLRVLFGTAEAG